MAALMKAWAWLLNETGDWFCRRADGVLAIRERYRLWLWRRARRRDDDGGAA